MKKMLLALLLAIQCFVGAVYAQQAESYNLKRALESLNDNDKESAIDFLNKELGENPHSTVALDLLGYIYFCDGELGTAVSLLDKAIKYAGKKDKEILPLAYYHRGGIRAALGDTLSSIVDYKEAVRLDPEYRQAIIELGDMLYYTKHYKESDETYQMLFKLDSGDPYPYYGIARNAYTNNDFETARREIKKGEMLDTDKERPAIMKMRLESRSNNPKATLEYAIDVLDANQDNTEAYYEIMNMSDSLYKVTLNRVIRQKFEHPDNDFWGFLLAHLHIRHNEPEKALVVLKPIYESESELKLQALYWGAECYDELEKEDSVVYLMDVAIQVDSTDAMFYYMRANAEFYLQDLKRAESDYIKVMELDKDYGYYCYYRLGWIKEMQKDYKGALNDYDMSIALNDTYAYTYMMKGNLLKDYLGREEEAKEAFSKCIEMDNGITEGTCKQYAYLGLGNIEQAIAVNDSILAKYDNAGSFYDAACLYSRMGKADEALEYLRKAFEKGFRRIKHMEADNDLDFIRHTPEYKKILLEYNDLSPKDNGVLLPANESNLEIPIYPKGNGTFAVKCIVNGLPMDFLLDTGSSSVSLSSTESDFMLKNGYLSAGDFKGYLKYRNASGDTRTAREIIIKEIKIGNRAIKNVKAVIIPNQEAPLLLGQNVLNRLGTLEIDHRNNMLKIHSYHK